METAINHEIREQDGKYAFVYVMHFSEQIELRRSIWGEAIGRLTFDITQTIDNDQFRIENAEFVTNDGKITQRDVSKNAFVWVTNGYYARDNNTKYHEIFKGIKRKAFKAFREFMKSHSVKED